MTNTTIRRVLAAAAIGAGFAVSVFAQAPAPLTRQDSIKVSASATITAIDLAKREVTLKKPSGETITLTVDQRVKRLNEMKVGDKVTADYYVAYAAELRPPSDEEKANPLVVLQQTAKAPADSQPAGGALRVMRAVVTVEGIDRPTKTVTVKGPGGNLFAVEAANPDNLAKIKLGDTVVVVYAEALAVTLEKPASK
jgi:Cu/Ag efflux protein CusF